MPSSDEYEITANAVSTRVVTLTTGEKVRFAPEALESVLRQVRANPVLMTREHLTFLPPMGYFGDGKIEIAEDGEQELVLYGRSFDQYLAEPIARTDPFHSVDQQSTYSGTVEAELQVEPRNYEVEDWDAAEDTAPVPLRPSVAWSALPPLEWLLAVPVTWGVSKFAGGFLSELGKESGKSFLAWLQKMSSRAREGARAKFVTISFDLEDGRRVLGFLPFQTVDDQRDYLENGISAAGYLAEVAGAQNAGVTTSAPAYCVYFRWRRVAVGVVCHR